MIPRLLLLFVGNFSPRPSHSFIPVSTSLYRTSPSATKRHLTVSLPDLPSLPDISIADPDGILASLPPDVAAAKDAALAYLAEASAVASAYAAANPVPAAALSAAVAFLFTSSMLGSVGGGTRASSPYPEGRYDSASAAEYWGRRDIEALSRFLFITVQSLGFGIGLLVDLITNRIEDNSSLRASQLATLLTKLGPSFIKLGQSLSIRTDLLSPAYIKGLKQLQDACPPFPTEQAIEIFERETGKKWKQVFSKISSQPVAAASLGQVYKGTLTDGRTVAVKIQRPDIEKTISLDMYLIRTVAPILKNTFNLNTDLVGIVDQWATGFVAELDYTAEAANAKIFMEKIAKTPLSSVVFAPPPIDELTSRNGILTTEWIDGERLDKSAQSDVTILCSIAMNAYLTMMLEMGVLHCDPHPGNLLRTPDGRLCILDWGMVTSLNPDLQISLIEHMAHLTSADYAEIPSDLLVLGFIPKDKAHLIDDSGVVETLAEIYGAWSAGGGAASVDVNKVVTQLQDLTSTRGNLFQIPPYFAYIAKSFSVLEGIGLSNDSNYSIINECLPYVSKRLLTDNSERTGGALSTFIFGPTKSDENRIIDYDRVEQLVSGFSDYSTSAAGGLLGREGDLSRTDIIDEQADQIIELLLTEEETPLQAIFLEQLGKILSASSRSAWKSAREASGRLPSGRSVLGTLVDPIGIWRTSPVVAVSDLDQKTIDATRKLIELIQVESSRGNVDLDTLTNQEVVEISTRVFSKLWSRRNNVLKTGGRLLTVLLNLTSNLLEKGERTSTAPSLMEPQTSASNDSNQFEESHMSMKQSKIQTKIRRNYPSEQESSRLSSARDMLKDLEATELR